MTKGDDIKKRLVNFAIDIIKLSAKLPRNPEGQHISSQILRSGTSPAPNYGEARGAESAKDFVHKLGITLRELNEAGIWLEIIKRSEMLPVSKVKPLAKECVELSKIISSSIRTVGKKKK